MIYLETDRLILRGWKEEDLPLFAAINNDPKVMEFMASLLSYQETADFIIRIKQEFQQKGFGLYAVEVKKTKEFIGFVGLHIPAFTAHFTPCVEIGWRLNSQYWGRGYASEAAKEVLKKAFTDLKLTEVVSFTTVHNTRSRKVMEKIGMHYDPCEDFQHPNLPLDHPLSKHVLYRIKQSY
jgi:RimJ/RimL family protein N-acetyltransferase